ncbi:pilus assembly protein TadG-related protein [Iamia majanohamensis]|uniref:Pilus assembly protein TadG-related protein n=1 Tax=Iamia majanohamensis TaxID=467976 RepID=A0AAE9YG79_9ACTN|nr:pilus assembly protein TadG-related protein [Iamia majanohamensis]WCO67952.1 pilus assembly protein TadG-related protein [Iamia majanohamensis]
MTTREERGSITAFVAVVTTALVLVAGMTYDGGQVIAAHNAARNDAEQAARAGAQQIDLDHIRTTNEPRLDPVAAETAALAYLQRSGATGTATVSDASITVTVTRVQPMRILPGADRTIVVRETATAVDEAEP